MTYEQLLPIYQQQTGKAGQDADFNNWVQGLINQSGSQNGVEGIPDGFVKGDPNTPTPSFNGDKPNGIAGAPTTPTLPALGTLNTLGGNYGTNQVAGQTGSYGSVGTTDQTQNGTQQQNTSSTGTSTQNTAGTANTTGTSTTSGTSVNKTGVDTPFDLNQLVNTGLANADARDSTNTNFLTDFINTGGAGFNSQVDQAVRNSLSGPGMSGAGDSARARAAGYAGAEVARNNAGQRLQAASQLAGPTAQGNALASYTPLFGKTSTDTNNNTTANNSTTASQGTTTGSTANTGLSNTVDFQNLVGHETGAGTASGNSAQQAGGLVPQSTPVQSGGCFVCTALVAHNMMHPGAVRRAVSGILTRRGYDKSLQGYMFYGPFLARAVLYNHRLAGTIRPLARAILYEENRWLAPRRFKFKLLPWLAHAAFRWGSWPIGFVFGKRYLTNMTVLNLLKQENLCFELL